MSFLLSWRIEPSLIPIAAGIGIPLVIAGWQGYFWCIRFFGLYSLFSSAMDPFTALLPALALGRWQRTNLLAAAGWSIFLKLLGIKALLAFYLVGLAIDLIGFLLGLTVLQSRISQPISDVGFGMADLVFLFSLPWAGGLLPVLIFLALLPFFPRKPFPGLLLLIPSYVPLLLGEIVEIPGLA